MPTESEGSATASTDDRGNSIWTLLPSFDPGSDDPREYRDKVLFLHGICPQKDKAMLAPRLAMLCKGTAWSQVKNIEPSKLTDPDGGVKVLLLALSSWDEAAELQTYDKCEKALYRIQQKGDETTMSFVNRLSVAFHELGDSVTIKELKAFILLRQSNLNAEDKRKVITLTGGTLDAPKIENAMRTLSTKILGSSLEGKKRIYPANYVDDDDYEDANLAEEDRDEDLVIEQLAENGDEDAIFVTEYENQILDLVQELPELASCFSSYTAARQRLKDRNKSRGFWPPKGKNKGKGKGKFAGKGQPVRRTLAERIASSSCRICGVKGHWRLECPQRPGATSTGNQETSNYATVTLTQGSLNEDDPEIVNELPWDVVNSDSARSSSQRPSHVSSLIQVQPELTLFGQHEYLVDPVHSSQSMTPTCAFRMKLQHLCQTWNQLRGTGAPCEEAFVVERAECAILDTGASKTVIGKDIFDAFVSQLPVHVQRQIKRADSQVIFRFGNNGVLPSLGSAYIPYGRKWLKVEIVKGKTPFLLSNAVMRQLRGQLNFDTNTLWIPELGKGIGLTLNSKGLYLIDIRELLGVNFDVANVLKIQHAVPPDSAAVQDQPDSPHPLGVDPLRGAPHGNPIGDSGQGAAPRGGCGPQPDLRGASSDNKAGRCQLASPVGHLHPGGRQVQGQDLPGHSRQPSRVRSIYHQSKGHGQVPGELPKLLPRDGECQGPAEDGEPAGETGYGDDTRANPSESHVQECQLEQQALKSEHVGGDQRTGGGNDHGGQRGSKAGLVDTDRGASETAGAVGLREFSNEGSTLERVERVQEKGLTAEQVAMIEGQLHELCSLCEDSFKEMLWSQPRVSKSQSIPGQACVELFEISCGFTGFMQHEHGGIKRREQAEVARPGIRDAQVRSSVLEKTMQLQPRHVWFSLGFKNLSREEMGLMLEWCQDLYFNQIVQGNHFHIWAPRDFVQFLEENGSGNPEYQLSFGLYPEDPSTQRK